MWNKSVRDQQDSLTAKVARYRQRPPRYADIVQVQRREELKDAVAANREEGDPPLMGIEVEFGELWVTGRVSDAEYLDLCARYVTESEGKGR